MLMSEQELIAIAKKRGYRPEILEKVYRLLDLLELFMAIPYLRFRLALKGGTAINLFYSDQLPRLSLDLDLNYVGSDNKEEMLHDRQELESIITDVLRRHNYELHRNPKTHAGGKMVLIYKSVLGNKGRLELDLNYMLRTPLWELESKKSPAWLKEIEVNVLDKHELAAGKLHALFGREASRDLFDSHRLLTKWQLDTDKLRLAFTVYAAMRAESWQSISIDNIIYNTKDIRDKLFPVLKKEHIPMNSISIEQWASSILEETKAALGKILPFNTNEIEFLNCLQKNGEIRPEIICEDESFCKKVKNYPALLWRIKQKNSNN